MGKKFCSSLDLNVASSQLLTGLGELGGLPSRYQLLQHSTVSHSSALSAFSNSIVRHGDLVEDQLVG